MSEVTTTSIGTLRRVPLREVWRHEAHDFTTWLETNIDELAEALGFGLTVVGREQRAGDFLADLIADGPNGETVVIENQLAPSDHRHLGQLITYAAAFDADIAVWIVERARPEHAAALTWLNNNATQDFYLVQIEGVRITTDDVASPAAALMTTIVSPSTEGKQAQAMKQGIASRHETYKRFWTDYLLRDAGRSPINSTTKSARRDPWLHANVYPGIEWGLVVNNHESRAELIFRKRRRDVFERFEAFRTELDREFGDTLTWDRGRTDEGQCRVFVAIDSGTADEAAWPELHQQLIAALVQLDEIVSPYLHQAVEASAEEA